MPLKTFKELWQGFASLPGPEREKRVKEAVRLYNLQKKRAANCANS